MQKKSLIVGLVVCFIITCGTRVTSAQSTFAQQLQQKLQQRKDDQTSSRKSVSDKTTKPTTKSSAPRTSSITVTSPDKYGAALELAVESKNLQDFNRLISWSTIASKATSGWNKETAADLRKTLLEESDGKSSIGARIISTVSNGGSYKFLGLRKSNKTVVALFRMILPGSRGVNFHEYSLARTKTGNVVAADLYVYLTGEPLSDSIRRNFIASLVEEKKAKEAGFEGKDQQFADQLETVKKITKALTDKDPAKARSLILSLPKDLRTDKAIQTLTLNTYKNSSAFQTVVDQIRKSSPSDVFMDMLAIDAFAGQKKYDKAVEAIDRIAKKVGQESYLMILKGRMLLKQGDKKSARSLIESAIKLDDKMLGGYWNLVSFSLEEKDHSETLRLLKIIDKKFQIKFRDLREIPSYKNFVLSKEFKSWQAHVQSNTAPTDSLKTSDSAPGTDSANRDFDSSKSSRKTNR